MSNQLLAGQQDRLFTTAEASFVLKQSRVRLQKWLTTSSPVRPRLARRGKREYRLIAERDLFYLAVLSRLLLEVRLELETKHRLYEAVMTYLEQPTPAEEIQFSDSLSVRNVSEAFDHLRAEIEKLQRAREMVICDPEIRGGEPVISGTRIPVQLVADMLRQGATKDEVLEGYPRLSAEQLELAVAYAEAYPKQGRPKHPCARRLSDLCRPEAPS